MSSSRLNKLKSVIKNSTGVTFNLSSNVMGDFNDETNFPHILLLTDAQVPRLYKAFTNGSSANIKFSKTQLSNMVQVEEVICEIPIYGIV